MRLKFWGTRGSIPVPGKNTLKYGGNTPCIEIFSKNSIIIFDAGSGIRPLGQKILKSKIKNIHIFISHSHWDHIQGLAFFEPFYRKEFNIKLYFCTDGTMDVEYLIDHQMNSIFFPVTKEIFSAKLSFCELKKYDEIKIDNLLINTIPINHTVNTLSFKITEKKKSVIYMTDNEFNFEGISEIEFIRRNRELVEFCKNAEYLIHDTMYTDTEYKTKNGWGHTSFTNIIKFANLVNLKNLILFHYNPDYEDKFLDEIIKNTKLLAKKIAPQLKCSASRELLNIKIN